MTPWKAAYELNLSESMVGVKGSLIALAQSQDCTDIKRNLTLGCTILSLAVQSPVWLCNLEIGTHCPDSENEHNLELCEILNCVEHIHVTPTLAN